MKLDRILDVNPADTLSFEVCRDASKKSTDCKNMVLVSLIEHESLERPIEPIKCELVKDCEISLKTNTVNKCELKTINRIPQDELWNHFLELS